MAITTRPDARAFGDAVEPATTAAADPEAGDRSDRVQLGLAAAITSAATAAAGVIHASAAGSHNGDHGLSILFAITAVAQLGVAAAVALRPRKPLLAAAFAVNL